MQQLDKIPSPESCQTLQTNATHEPYRIAVIMTSHNRREKTLACLAALSNGFGLENVALQGVLVDDGSCDGTSEAVAEFFPWVQVIRADGSLYWCRGMHKAFALAMDGNFDYFLWLNDDTLLHFDAVSRLLICESELRSHHGQAGIVVGSTVDEQSGNLTYGGERRAAWWRRISFVTVQPSDRPQLCDSMNGNIVLIPAEVARLVGNLDPAFEHAMGDNDYALRARKLGVSVWLAPGVHGTCGHNPRSGTFQDCSLSLRRRWSLLLSPKGIPWRSWLVLTRRHAGPIWPMYFVWPYLKLLSKALVGRG